MEGYIGAPTDGNQCYQQLSISLPANYTLLPHTSTAFATDLDFTSSNVDVKIHFVARYGEFTVYDTLSNRAILVNVDSDSYQHTAVVREGFQISRVNNRETSTNQTRRRRQAVDISDVFVYELPSNGRLTITVPTEQNGFESLQHYITIITGASGTQFYVFYEQEIAQLNYFVFFSILLSCFLLTFGVALLIWKAIKIEMKRRARQRAKARREARANRPFVKVRVFFDRNNLRVKQNDKKDSTKKVSFSSHVSTVFTRDGIDQSAASNLKLTKRHRRKVPVNPLNLVPWPLAREVVNGNDTSVHTLMIKLPTKSRVHKGHVICTGSCLVRQPTTTDETKVWKKWSNRCVPLESEQTVTAL